MSTARYDELFEAMVESVGVKAFATSMSISARQVYRMLNGAQPNPIKRFNEAIIACEGPSRELTLDYLCQQQGGYFVRRTENLNAASVNAVKESAEAIIAISEGRPPKVTIKEIREAIAALAALERRLQSGPVDLAGMAASASGAIAKA